VPGSLARSGSHVAGAEPARRRCASRPAASWSRSAELGALSATKQRRKKSPPGGPVRASGGAVPPATQPWWLGYLETGASDVVFSDVERVMLYADWGYVLIEAGPEQAARWRDDDQWKGRLPDLMFPVDRSWLLSTLWDAFWSCLGGPQEVVDAFLKDSFLGGRTRVVEVSAEDATPPGHTAI
jgi:hypothetical protein